MQRMKIGGAVATIVALLVVPAAGSPAQTPAPAVGVEITPARVERDLPDRSVSQTFTITNHESAQRRITMSVAGLGHDLEGTPVFLEPADATDELHLDQASFVLDPGQQRLVAASGAIPAGGHALYAAVIAEFAPLEQPTGAVESHSRVAALLLMRGPRPWTQTLSVEDVGMLPGAKKGTFDVFGALKDTGDVHVRPTGTARITKDGTLLATVPLTGAVILPGFARRISGVWTPPAAPSGKLRIDIVTRPQARGTGYATFSKGTAERPTLKIVNLRAHDQSGALVTATLVNTGKVAVAPTVTLFAREGGVERARTILVQDSIAPGASADIQWQPGLDDGVYVVTAQARSGDLLLDESSTGLRLGAVGAQGAARPARRKPALIVVAAILLLLCLAGLWLLWRRRRKDDEQHQEQPKAAAA
jgi:hypothetical protein